MTRLREFKLDGVPQCKGYICCTSLGQAKNDKRIYRTQDGNLSMGSLVPHADIVNILDETGFLYKGEDICLHNGNDVQAQAFCNDCLGYLPNLVRRIDAGTVLPAGTTTEHRILFDRTMLRLGNTAKKSLSTDSQDRTKVYLMTVGEYWERFSLLETINVSDIYDQDSIECLLYGTIKTKDKQHILLFQIEALAQNKYKVSSVVLKGDSHYDLVNTVSEDCVNPFVHVSKILDILVAKDMASA
jgi:hypothetical protein